MSGKKGMVFYLVLVSIIVALVLASAILNIILSQATFSRHQASRVQAYYAAMAGANYAFEKLRSGNQPSYWYRPSPDPNVTYTHCICRSAPFNTCTYPDSTIHTCATDQGDIIDDVLLFVPPTSSDPRRHSAVSQVAITVGGTGPGGTLKISSKATYTAPQ